MTSILNEEMEKLYQNIDDSLDINDVQAPNCRAQSLADELDFT